MKASQRRPGLRLALMLALAGSGMRAQAMDWPSPSWPEGAKPELVAADAVLNGRHSRIWQASLPLSRAEAERFFQNQWGPKHTRESLRGNTVLGTRQGDFFLTLQLKESLGQVQAQLMATALTETPARSRALQDTLSWLPAEVSVLQTLESTDEGRRGLTVTAMAPASVEQLGEALGLQLRRRGWTPRHETVDTVNGRAARQLSVQQGGEDIVIAITDLGERRSVVIQRNKERQP
jgi:hypothetical protein